MLGNEFNLYQNDYVNHSSHCFAWPLWNKMWTPRNAGVCRCWWSRWKQLLLSLFGAVLDYKQYFLRFFLLDKQEIWLNPVKWSFTSYIKIWKIYLYPKCETIFLQHINTEDDVVGAWQSSVSTVDTELDRLLVRRSLCFKRKKNYLISIRLCLKFSPCGKNWYYVVGSWQISE